MHEGGLQIPGRVPGLPKPGRGGRRHLGRHGAGTGGVREQAQPAIHVSTTWSQRHSRHSSWRSRVRCGVRFIRGGIDLARSISGGRGQRAAQGLRCPLGHVRLPPRPPDLRHFQGGQGGVGFQLPA